MCGANFDTLFANDTEKKFEENTHASLISSTKETVRKRYRLRLSAIAEKTKKSLFRFKSFSTDLSAFGVNSQDDNDDLLDLELDKCIEALLDRSIKIVKQCISECGLTSNDIYRVVLIGGSSRLNLVEDRLWEFFGKEKISRTVNPDEAVAFGACQSLVEPLQLKDRIVYSLCQKLVGKRIPCLIPRQMKIKCTSEALETHPVMDYTTTVNCAIYQGNAANVGYIEPQDKCDLIEEYQLTGYDKTMISNVTFLTTLTIDEWGIINVVRNIKRKRKSFWIPCSAGRKQLTTFLLLKICSSVCSKHERTL